MNEATKNEHLIRFSVFEVDRNSGELFKQGRKVKLQGQPFELLVALLERPGEVVTREELRQKVWSSATIGDFDHGLNRAVNRIREALGDSAETPQFIETLPRRGYRFIGSIQEENRAEPAPVGPSPDHAGPSAGEAKHRSHRRAWFIVIGMAGVAVAAGVLVTWRMTHHQSAPPPDLKLRQLTTNSFENRVTEAGSWVLLHARLPTAKRSVVSGRYRSWAVPRCCFKMMPWLRLSLPMARRSHSQETAWFSVTLKKSSSSLCLGLGRYGSWGQTERMRGS